MDEPLLNQPRIKPDRSSAAMLKTGDEVPTSLKPMQPSAAIEPMTDAEAVSRLSMDQRITLVSLTASLGEQEADRLWKRYGIMLTLTAGLIAISSYTLTNKLNGVTVIIAAAGLLLTFFWYRIMTLSQFYEERWRKDLAAIINEDEVLTTLLRSRSKLGPRNRKPMYGSATGNAKAVVILAFIFWIALGIHAIFS